MLVRNTDTLAGIYEIAADSKTMTKNVWRNRHLLNLIVLSTPERWLISAAITSTGRKDCDFCATAQQKHWSVISLTFYLKAKVPEQMCWSFTYRSRYVLVLVLLPKSSGFHKWPTPSKESYCFHCFLINTYT